MTQLPHNPQIWVEDLPEDARTAMIHRGGSCEYLIAYKTIEALPPGTWKLICLGNQATEGEAREIVQKVEDGYLKYGSVRPLMERLANMGNPWYADYSYYKTALQSLASLITANGWKNPVFLRKEN